MATTKRTLEVKDPDTGITYVFEIQELNMSVSGRTIVRAFKNRGKENEIELPPNNHFESPAQIGGNVLDDEQFTKLIADAPELEAYVSKVLDATKKRYI